MTQREALIAQILASGDFAPDYFPLLVDFNFLRYSDVSVHEVRSQKECQWRRQFSGSQLTLRCEGTSIERLSNLASNLMGKISFLIRRLIKRRLLE